MLAVACIVMVMGVAAFVVGSADSNGDFLGRVKRQAVPSLAQWTEVMKCCPFPMLLTVESKTGCFTQPPMVPGGPLLPNWANPGCDIECAYKKQGFVNSANSIDISVLTARGAELAAVTPVWANIINEAVVSCTKDNPPAVIAGSECKSGAAETSQCLTGHLLLNCPAEAVEPSPKCAEVMASYRAFRAG